ncbi:MAG: hypothetical protein JWM44_2882 [Bacilli bacterium]|nr:hypothetical protein [Bacilli bacterium]
MKEAYFFSHDSNARNDPNILQMRAVYGVLGYGWYWILIEMLRDVEGYKLDMRSKYAYHAFASQMQCDSTQAHDFITECIEEFKLFDTDYSYFWSNSLIRRMKKMEDKSEKARISANARWAPKDAPNKGSSNIELDSHSESNANALNNDALNEKKVKEMKLKENKDLKELHESEFNKFWNLYPSKKGKTKALAKWLKLAPELDFEKVMAGTQAYIDFCKAAERTHQDGSTFVNNLSWNDDWTIKHSDKPRSITNGRPGTSGKPIIPIISDSGPPSKPRTPEDRAYGLALARKLDGKPITDEELESLKEKARLADAAAP